MAQPAFNGATKWLLGVAAALLIAFVSAAAAHMANGEIHETAAQKRHRIKDVVHSEVRVELEGIRTTLREIRADLRDLRKELHR